VSSRPRRSADVIIADWSRGKIRRAIVRPLEESRHVLRGRPYVTAAVLRGTFSVSGFLASRQVRGFPSRVSFAIASDSGVKIERGRRIRTDPWIRSNDDRFLRFSIRVAQIARILKHRAPRALIFSLFVVCAILFTVADADITGN